MLLRTGPLALALGGLVLVGGCSGAAEPQEPAKPTATSPPVTASAHPSRPAGTPGPTTDDSNTPTTCAQSVVGRMPLADRVGQLLLVGVPSNDPRAATPAVERYRLGGIFLAGRSTLAPGELRARLQGVQRTASALGLPRLHVAVDQEGGAVSNLRGAGVPQLPAALRQADWRDGDLTAAIERSSDALHAAGVTVDLAPVADVVPAQLGDRNAPIGAFGRQYGSTPDDVAQKVRLVVQAMQRRSVMATLKHFPGLGRVTANTDYSAGVVDAQTTATDPFLLPFRGGIEAGAAFVMVSSARYPRIDPQHVATFSPAVVTTLLRQRLGFEGVAVTDDVGAAVALRAVPVGERAVRFVAAGGDLVLTVRLADAGPLAASLAARSRRDPAFAAQVDAAAVRVVASKVRAGLVTCG